MRAKASESSRKHGSLVTLVAILASMFVAKRYVDGYVGIQRSSLFKIEN